MTNDTTNQRGDSPGATTASRQRRVALATVTVVGGTLVVNGAPASAAPFDVTNADASGPGSLAQAIEDANATAEADTITIASGVTGTIEFLNTSKVKYDLKIEGPGSDLLTLSHEFGDVLYVYNGAALTVSGLTFADVGDDAIDGNGVGDITIEDSNFERAQSALELDRSGAVMISNVTMSDVGRGFNVEDAVGAVSMSGIESIAGDDAYSYARSIEISQTEGNVSITESTLAGHVRIDRTTSDGVAPGGNVTVRALDISTNGYSSLSLSRNEGLATVEDVTISSERFASINVSGESDYAGPGMYTSTGTAAVSDVTLSSDDATGVLILSRLAEIDVTRLQGAGSIYVDRVDSGQLRESTIVGTDQTNRRFINKSDEELVAETAAFQRDGSVMSFYGSTFELEQVTVVGHTAGTVMNLTKSDVTLSHSTFGGNSLSGPMIAVSEGYGGIRVMAEAEPEPEFDGSALHLDHTILSGQPAAGFDFAQVVERRGGIRAKALDPEALEITADYSLVPTDVATDYTLNATNIGVDDPKLGPLQDNGSTQPTTSPLPGSAAIDAGDPAIADAPLLDARGEARIVDVIDIGAVESTTLLTSIAPARFVDTRTGPKTIDGQYEGDGKRQSGTVYTVDIAGRGMVPEGATAVVMNITAIAPEAGGYVTVFGCDDEQPNASSLNFADTNAGNEVIAGLAEDGSICLFVQGVAHLTVDVVAYATELSSIRPVTPARSFESRIGQSTADGRFQGTGVLAAGSQTTIPIAGRNGVPADAEVVIVNVTAIRPASNGFVTVHGCLPERPNASSLNYQAGAVRANEIVVQLNEFGELCVYTSAETNLAVDVVGYLPTGAIETVAPARLLDTRTGGSTTDGANQRGGQVAGGGSVTLPVSGRAGVPEGVKAVVVNVTAIRPETRGFVTVDGCADPRPTASSLNYEAGINGANEIIAGVNDDGEICLYTSASTDLAVDVVAFIR